MNDQTRQFLRERFREYYSERRVSVPPGLVNREWGFIFYDETPGVAMRRHKAFNSEGELKDYLASMPPAHAYHSAAYYQYPQAPTMLEKKWLGADLIFDLDADHLPGVKDMSYSEMLANVKKEIIRLIDEFLIDDLGFREKDLDIVFSGGRGYHVHVRDERVRTLKSPERREIVDYLLGTGLDIDRMIERANVIAEGQKGKKTAGVWRIHGFDEQGGHGWNRRLAFHIANTLSQISALPDKGAKERLRGFSLDQKQATAMLKKIRDPAVLDGIQLRGLLDLPGNPEAFLKNVLSGTIEEFKVDLAGKTDEPVTADVKRLIRLPGSIHGGSSFRVVPLTRPGLENFNPLEDAIIFSDSPVRVLVTRPMEAEVKGKVYRVSEGVGRLPENVAMFLMCRGCAEYEP
ncbi:MAG TPA: DNA primase catalytic subunit PriS [Methanocella sp.]|jgi:DNA primase small subunit